jgi:hypothetical protein
MRLIELQRELQAAILEPTAPAGRLLGLAIPERLHVHHSHFWTKMREFVPKVQPLLAKLLPADELDEVIRRFIVAYPPRLVIANGVCAQLAEFLRTTAPWSAWPILGELAALDYARTQIAANAEEIAVTSAKLAALPPEVVAPIRFRLKKRAALVTMAYRFELARIHLLARATPLDAEPTHALIYMVDRRFATLVLDPRGYRALAPLVSGITLLELVDHVRGQGFDEGETRRMIDHLVESEVLVAI